MAENLEAADVEQYTKGRLLASNPETQRALDAALARVRRWCGWHVSPVVTETIYLDVPEGSSMLVVPTMKIDTLNTITVGGTAVNVSDVTYSREAPGILQTKNFLPWGDKLTTSGLGQIAINLSHGYAAAEAEDFREAVLQLIDQATLNVGTGGMGPLTGKKVDDVEYRWSGMVDRSWGIAKHPLNESILYQFRLLPFA